MRLFRISGWLLGQCIHNHCAIGIDLPELFFTRLLEGERFQVGYADPSTIRTKMKLAACSFAYQSCAMAEEYGGGTTVSNSSAI